MDILAALLDSGKTEMGIFIGDCLTVASKFSRASVVCVVYYRYMQEEERSAYLRFLGAILRNYPLASDANVMVSHIPSIYKQLKRLVHYETNIGIACMIPEYYYHICIISMEFPIPGITVPLIVNEFFSLFQREEAELRSFVCRNCAMLFSEFVGVSFS